MKIYRSGYRVAALSFGMLLTIGLLTARADDKIKTVEVDCTKGKTLAHALEKGNEDKPVVVVVQGICNENVVIDRDDVTLQGHSSGDGVTGLDSTKDTILIDGARRVVIEHLSITGGKNGVVGRRGASFTVLHSTIQNSIGPLSDGNGIKVHQNSQALIHGNLIEGHPVSGINVTAGGNTTITANTIQKNNDTGI